MRQGWRVLCLQYALQAGSVGSHLYRLCQLACQRVVRFPAEHAEAPAQQLHKFAGRHSCCCCCRLGQRRVSRR